MIPKFFNFREILTFSRKNFSNRVFINSTEDHFASISYLEADNFVDSFSEYLKKISIPEMEKIAVVTNNKTMSILLFIASICCDRIFVPIDSKLNKVEVLQLLDQAAPGLIICDKTCNAYCETWACKNGAETQVLDEGRTLYDKILSYKPIKHFKSKCCSSDTAEIIFTNETHTAKAVVMSHGALIANAQSLIRRYGFTSDDRFFSTLPIVCCAGQVFPVLCSMLTGAETILAKPKITPKQIWELMSQHQITWPMFTTAFLTDHFQNPHHKMVTKGVLLNGPTISKNLIEKMEKKLGFQVLHVYGVIEVADFAVSEPINDPMRSIGSVGRPADISSVRIITQGLQIADPNTIGTIYLRSSSRFSKYHKENTNTSTYELNGYIKTSDSGYIDDKGNLHILDQCISGSS